MHSKQNFKKDKKRMSANCGLFNSRTHPHKFLNIGRGNVPLFGSISVLITVPSFMPYAGAFSFL